MKYNNDIKPNNVSILSRILSASGKSFKEIHPEKDGRRKPNSVYLVNHIKSVLTVRRNIE